MRIPSSLFVLAAGSLGGLALVLLPSACGHEQPKPDVTPVVETAPAKAAPTPEDAKAFVAKTNEELKVLNEAAARTDWIKSTYITDDTEAVSAKAAEILSVRTAALVKEARKFEGLKLDDDTARALKLLRLSADLVAPPSQADATELAAIAAKMTGLYGKGKYCPPGKGEAACKDLEMLSKTLAESRNYDELLEAWTGWHSIAPPLRPMYQRYVELSNKGAQDIGFADVADLWKSRYDMSSPEFEATTEKLWQQVKPLYDDLHCYVRSKLVDVYKGKVKPDGLIPAHVLGNMWAQEWDSIYPLVEPYKGQSNLDVDAALKKKKWTEKQLVELGESFFVSLGMQKLPQTFWERSLFVKPQDREVVCHASAWDVTFNNDVRIKMCIKVDNTNLVTIHHELGHIYYYQNYYTMPVLFQSGANDGFHEAIGDTIARSVTPGYLQKNGILDKVVENEKSTINIQMKDALEKVAFLPFGLLMDKWRWDVFSGKTSPEKYNETWWKLRRQYQGIDAPVARSEKDFDPGAKYHIPANVPYTRYFLAAILQYQFHRALCKAAGHEGPLHTCSIFGNAAAGQRLKATLAMGASKPWPDALEALTGQREMDATAILEYFAPLRGYLQEQNKGKTCGWKAE
jgi:peptidyl-dipeptidase A